MQASRAYLRSFLTGVDETTVAALPYYFAFLGKYAGSLYILDEPTTGLHFADVHKLTEILRRLTDDGNTVIVIEHNLDVIKTADYIIDIGPEGGERGGTVVAHGTPEDVAENENSYTGKYIKKML